MLFMLFMLGILERLFRLKLLFEGWGFWECTEFSPKLLFEWIPELLIGLLNGWLRVFIWFIGWLMRRFWLIFYGALNKLNFWLGSLKILAELFWFKSLYSRLVILLEKALLSWLVSKIGLFSCTFLNPTALLNAEDAIFLGIPSLA